MNYEIFDGNFYAIRVKYPGKENTKNVIKMQYKYRLYYFDLDEKFESIFIIGDNHNPNKIEEINGKKYRFINIGTIDLKKIKIKKYKCWMILKARKEEFDKFIEIVKKNLSPCWGYVPEETAKKKPYRG